MESTNNNIIITENLKKDYKDDDIVVKAVRGIDLQVKAGEFTAVVGPSGSGKTTFLNIISGLDTPSEGRVWLHNKLLSEMSGKELSDFRRDHIGFIFQAYNLIPVLTVEENIEYIMLLMRELNRKTGMTFIFSTHDRIVMERADRVITLRDGLIVKDEISNQN